jgi:phosphoglycerol transferase MdoB-like AlkP superfamily enzyme
MTNAMEDNPKIIEELLGKAAEYGKTELQLAKLKVLDKTSDAVSTAVPHLVVIVLALIFLLFVNLGIAFWLGGILGNIYYGFFAVAAFYGITALVLHFFMHKWLKKHVGNYIVRNVLK